MPPKKKKNKNTHNEFYYFMQDQKKILKVENIHWDTMDDLVAICHPRWKILGEAEKSKYKDIAKKAKECDRENLETKFDSRGRSLAFVQNEKVSHETHLSQMVKRVKSALSEANDLGQLKTQKFFLMHINILCSVDEDPARFLPCEIALLQFNLQEGIIDTFHTFIKPPDSSIPLGYGYEMQKNADDTHGITLDDDPMWHENSTSYKEIATRIMKRINPGGVREAVWPIYTLGDDEEMVSSVMNDLLNWSDLPIEQDFRVYHVHQLLYHLSHYLPSGANFKSELLAGDQLASDIYSYTVGMACPYHDKIDKSRFCSMNCVKRWAFLILDKCCQPFGIIQEPDTHRHVERPQYLNKKPKYQEEHYVKLGPSLDDEPIKVTAEADKDLFGAPKTRAAPAGFCDVDLSKTVPNPKKMSKKEREELERTHFAKTGQSLEDWITVEKTLPPLTQSPWGNSGGSPICFAPPTVANNFAPPTVSCGNNGNNAWRPLRKPNSDEPATSPWGAPSKPSAPPGWGVSAPDPTSGPSPWGSQAVPKPKEGPGEEDFPTLGAAKPLKF